MDPRNDVPGSRSAGDRQSSGPQSGDLGSTVRDVGSDVREKALDLADQAKESARTVVESRKSQMADELGSVSDALRDAAGRLSHDRHEASGRVLGRTADGLDRLSRSLDQRDLDELIADAEDFARRNSAAFLGGAVLLGFFAARFLKSSQERLSDRGNDDRYRGNQYATRSPQRSRTVRYRDGEYITYAEEL